jgi:hypothetical protein
MYAAFWKANDPSNRIYFSWSDGSLPPGRPINDVDSTSASPTACVFGGEFAGQFYVFWKANDPSNLIYYTISPDGSTFPPGKPINGVDSTSAAPFACVFQNKIYLFWKANDPSNRIYATVSSDGQNWPPGRPINDVDSTSDSPAACVYQNPIAQDSQMYLFWKANDPSNRIYYSFSILSVIVV